MKANLMERTIEMTKSEANKAGKIGSPKANELQSYRTAYPDFTIKVKEEKKRSTYKGRDYDYMKKYSESHDNEEKTIMCHIGGAYDAFHVAVIGIPDARLGEIAAAIIELKEGAATTEADIEAFCMGLPRYKRPKRIIFASVPRNPTGKIEKPLLRKKYAGERLVEIQTKS